MPSAAPFKTGRAKRLVMLGDSLTAGYGIGANRAFPALIETQLREHGKNVEVVNAGISGTTTATGLSRLRALLDSKPDLLVLGLGANDGLRGISVAAILKNMSEVIELAQAHRIVVVLAGMRMPSLNIYGPSYASDFEAVFKTAAARFNVPLIPFLLEGVAGNSRLNIGDGIHPNEEGHRKMAETVLPYLLPLL